jgi:membrane protease YdiL (CAAX protease family)
MKLSAGPRFMQVLASLLLVFAILPFISWVGELNGQINFPEALEWLENWFRNMEDEASTLTEAFLSTTSLGGLVVNLLIIAVLAALGEEFIFRGIILRLFKEWTGNTHFAVIVSAVLFSALHMQFFGFAPRIILGLVLGYLFVWSGSLWLPIIYHFINNAMAVLVAFLDARGMIQSDYEEFGASDMTWVILGSFIFSLGLMGVVYYLRVKNEE